MPMHLEGLQPDATIRGILSNALVTVVSVAWHGSDALTLVYRGTDGRVADEILYRQDEARLGVAEAAKATALHSGVSMGKVRTRRYGRDD